MWRWLANLALALLVTAVLAAAAAFGVQGFMILSDRLPQPPMWLVIATPILAAGAALYGRFRKRRSTAEARARSKLPE